jgi:septal ring factor EnvC (AmiA/AmiB activator)
MKLATKLYIAAAVLVALLIVGGGLVSGYRIRSLERNVDSAKTKAETLEQTASTRESDAAAYEQKIAYLERQLIELKEITRKQDERLEKLNTNSRTAREHTDRARRARTVASNAGSLCDKLAGLGHPCE